MKKLLLVMFLAVIVGVAGVCVTLVSDCDIIEYYCMVIILMLITNKLEEK